MTKKIALFLALTLVISGCFAACSSKKTAEDDTTTTNANNLENSGELFGFEEGVNGNTVAVVYDEDGNAYEVDKDGKKTDKKISNPKNAPSSSNTKNNTDNKNQDVTPNDKPSVPNNTGNAKGTTSAELTTLPGDKDKVPSTSDKGTPVKFSDSDISTVTYMLEVPYLYTANYENSDKVPITLANHVACWMVQENGSTSSTFASGEIVLDLFKYFAQTVVGYKTNCNSDSASTKAPITYNQNNDTFSITANAGNKIEKQTHSVSIQEIEYLGNNNYYKVTATVTAENNSGCNKKQVVAVIQKNKLDSSLGFSVKALKWS